MIINNSRTATSIIDTNAVFSSVDKDVFIFLKIKRHNINDTHNKNMAAKIKKTKTKLKYAFSLQYCLS